MSISVFNLPLAVQFVLASGYLAYCVGFMGARQHHRPVDLVFLSLAFSLVASSVLVLIEFWWPISLQISVFAAFLVTVTAGGLWRKWGDQYSSWFMRKTKVTWSDNSRSVLERVFADTTHHPSQITVEKDDGEVLHCENTKKFRNAPFGPFILGLDESVLMYVTKKKNPGEDWEPVDNVYAKDWGWELTYIPRHKIREMNVRFL